MIKIQFLAAQISANIFFFYGFGRGHIENIFFYIFCFLQVIVIYKKPQLN